MIRHEPSERQRGELRVDGVFGGRSSDLLLSKSAGNQIALSWSPSCADDEDYSVYEGVLGDFTSHRDAVCSTGGATSTTRATTSSSRTTT